MGKRYELAEAAASVEIGRRHPYLTLFAKRLPALLAVALVALAGWALTRVEWSPGWNWSWLWIGAGGVAVLAGLWLAGRRWGSDLVWRMRLAVRRY